MNEVIIQNIDRVSNHFGLKLRHSSKCYMGCCPIHEGDNPTAFNIYHTGHTTTGNWRCNTGNCHKYFPKNAMGFIQALISVKKHNWAREGDKVASFFETVRWCEEFFKVKYKTNDNYDPNDESLSSYLINSTYNNKNFTESFSITNEQYEKSGLAADSYFLNRNYQNETINDFQIRYCGNPQKPMYCRSVIPLHDETGDRIIGCLGRSVWEKCEVCTAYHNPKSVCPSKEKVYIYSKWKNSINFPSESRLYNFHRAKNSIQKSGIVLLTEGQPNVWRLHESGFPMSLSCFGSKFSQLQKKVLDTTGAHTIIIVPDEGDPGKKLISDIISKCKNSYNIVTIEPSYKDDIGKCNIETVKTILSPFIEKYKVK